MDERKAIAGLSFALAVERVGNRHTHRYGFPGQETDLRGGEDLRDQDGNTIGTLAALDPVGHTIDIKKLVKSDGCGPGGCVRLRSCTQ